MVRPEALGVAMLTLRQRDILRLSWHGLAYKQIARLLGVSQKTVQNTAWETHRRLGLTHSGNPKTLAALALWRAERSTCDDRHALPPPATGAARRALMGTSGRSGAIPLAARRCTTCGGGVADGAMFAGRPAGRGTHRPVCVACANARRRIQMRIKRGWDPELARSQPALRPGARPPPPARANPEPIGGTPAPRRFTERWEEAS